MPLASHGVSYGCIFITKIMIILREDQWDDIKDEFLSQVKYEYREDPLIRFDTKKNVQEEIGTRETYEFTKNDVDYMVILDKEYRLTKTTSEKEGKFKEHYSRSPNEFTYKLSIKFRDKDGSWKDSSALENSLEQE